VEFISLGSPLQLRGVSDTSSRGHAVRMLILTVLLRPFGNLSLAFGMKHFPQVLALDPLPYLRAFANPYVTGGIFMLVLSLLTRMALMSLVDLSVILPLTAIGYILSVMLGSVVLGEHVGLQQWMGTVLVFLGVALVSSTRLRTPEAAA
jgi:drug/metabolite transporter (DMT)-like permease